MEGIREAEGHPFNSEAVAGVMAQARHLGFLIASLFRSLSWPSIPSSPSFESLSTTSSSSSFSPPAAPPFTPTPLQTEAAQEADDDRDQRAVRRGVDTRA